MSKSELQEQIENVKREIEDLKILTNVGNMESFELIIKKIKDDMSENIKEEDWKSFKQNKDKISKMRGFTDYIEKQTQVIEDKEDELKDLQYQLDNYQPSLFEEQQAAENVKHSTEITHNDQELFTGDVFEKPENELLLIFESNEHKDKFAIIGLENEVLLNYPKNRECLNECSYIGNAYDDAELQKKLEKYFTPEANASESEDSESDSEE